MREELRDKVFEIVSQHCNYCGRNIACPNCEKDTDAILSAVKESLPPEDKSDHNADECSNYEAGQIVGWNDYRNEAIKLLNPELTNEGLTEGRS